MKLLLAHVQIIAGIVVAIQGLVNLLEYVLKK